MDEGKTPILQEIVDIENQIDLDFNIDEDDTCPICWEPKTNIVKLKCNHKICLTCKEQILPNKNKEKLCPFCRDVFAIVKKNIVRQNRNRQNVNTDNLEINNETTFDKICTTISYLSVLLISILTFYFFTRIK